MRYLWALGAVLLFAAGASAATILEYTGDAITGTKLTIKCKDDTLGYLWELDLLHGNDAPGGSGCMKIERFDDKTDTVAFNYSQAGGWGPGMWQCHVPIRGTNDVFTFTENVKTTSQYQYTILETYRDSALSTKYISQTVYTFNPSTDTGTTFTAVRTFTNKVDGVEGWTIQNQFPCWLSLGIGTRTVANGYAVGTYDQVTGLRKHIKVSDGSDAIWKFTDNIDDDDGTAGHNPTRNANPNTNCWIEAKTMLSAAALESLVVGREFHMTTETKNSSTDSQRFDVRLGASWDASGYPSLHCRVDPQSDWPTPTLPLDYTETRTIALFFNITNQLPGPGDPDKDASTVAVLPGKGLVANGFDTSKITITLKDSAGTLTDNFSSLSVTSDGSNNTIPLPPSKVSTGVYGTTISTTTAQTKTIEVVVNKTGGGTVTVTQHPTVVFDAIAPNAKLVYSGDDISGDTGTLTIKCVKKEEGEQGLWELDLKRMAYNYGLAIQRFDDLVDAGSFNYTNPGDWGLGGLFLVHGGVSDAATFAMEEVYKGEDAYEYRVTETYNDTNGVPEVQCITLYHILPSLPAGTQFNALRTVKIVSSVPIVEDRLADKFMTSMVLNDGGYNARPWDEIANPHGESYLSDYEDDGGVWKSYHRDRDGNNALWEIQDNLDLTNLGRNGALPAWGQGTAMDNAVVSGLGILPGRTFKISTDVVPGGDPYRADIYLRTEYTADYTDGVIYHNSPWNWGQATSGNPPGAWWGKWSYLDFNITDSDVPPSANLVISAAVGYDWVYQNTQTTTQDRHLSVLTVTVEEEASPGESYAVAFTENGGAVTDFTIQTVGGNKYNIVGGRTGSSTVNPGAASSYTIGVQYTGNTSGKVATASVLVQLRKLGDIVPTGDVDGDDKAQMNRRLNSLTVAYPDRSFNLTGDLDGLGNPNIDGDDKAVMNRLLNSLVIQ